MGEPDIPPQVLGFERPQALSSIDEWQDITEMYNYEIEKLGGKIDLGRVRTQEDIYTKLNDIIRKRQVTERTTYKEQSREDYVAKRQELLTKVDNIWKR
jgi:hypothetical protein